MRLLVVEDEPLIASFIRKGLTAEGHAIEVAGDGPSGVAAFLAAPALDVKLPGFNGYEVLRRIREVDPLARVIMLTARGVHTILTAAGPVAAVAGDGVATSSSERRSWTLGDGTVAHHLIDPATSNPACRGTAVVAGTDPVAADVLASCLVIRPELIASLAVPAARISLDGSVATTTSWPEVAR